MYKAGGVFRCLQTRRQGGSEALRTGPTNLGQLKRLAAQQGHISPPHTPPSGFPARFSRRTFPNLAVQFSNGGSVRPQEISEIAWRYAFGTMAPESCLRSGKRCSPRCFAHVYINVSHCAARRHFGVTAGPEM